MLSILIPVYNWSVVELVQELRGQCLLEQIDFEIIVIDDNSAPIHKENNSLLHSLNKIVYKELTQNIGRARIRNVLGQTARYPYLLFMDADASAPTTSFIKNYLSKLPTQQVLYGGCNYSKTPPSEPNKQLHYHYGKKRETLTVPQRKAAPYQAFKTFNFLIPKAIFLAIQFDESIQQYGHEDTIFGQELEKRNIPILHIDNPLVHTGIENIANFLSKQQQAIETLYQLYKEGKNPKSRLIQTYKKIKYWKVEGIMFGFLKYGHSYFTKQLNSKNPNLFYLDLYKLHYWLKITSS